MPSVMTLSGTEDLKGARGWPIKRGLKRCKWVRNGRTGCKILLCKLPDQRPKFEAGTSRCPVKG